MKLIDGIKIINLNKFTDERGSLLHFIRNDSSYFEKFGEIYFSITHFNNIKGWKLHLRMKQNFVVPMGNMKIIILDQREKSLTKNHYNEFCIGEENYQLLSFPEDLWYSFTPLNGKSAMIANCTTIPHDPSESLTKELHYFDSIYQWDKGNGA